MGERTENLRVKRLGKMLKLASYRIPHAVAKFAFLQLTFSAALDLSSLVNEKMKMYMGSYIAIAVLAAYATYSIFEIIMAVVYRSYIIKNQFHKNI